jgi:hypothetical protein
MHHTECIPVGFGQNNLVGAVGIAPVRAASAELNESFDLGGLVCRVKVEVVTLMILCV